MNSKLTLALALLGLIFEIVFGHGDHGDAESLFQWTTIDYNWPTRAARDTAISTRKYVPLNNAINGIRVYDNKIFVTVPRFGDGVPSTLNTLINAHPQKRFLTSRTVLQPYPRWDMQKEGNCTAFQKVQNIEIVSWTDFKVLNDVVHVTNGVNGIAISANFDYVYYSPIAGTALYQIPTKILRNASSDFSAHVRKVGDKPSQGDGMIMSTKNSLYFSVLAKNAVAMWELHRDIEKYGSEGKVMMDTLTYEANDPTMEWVDSLALDSFGYLWFTTSRLQLYLNKQLTNDSINFRIWRAFVHEPSYAYFDSRTRSESNHIHSHNSSSNIESHTFVHFALFALLIMLKVL
ncbi:uncharacterized protein LOC132712920 [Ruditapes philippinarum]|uniref:uncharacterized protein LOC132712920 n=1 Tax=Ruditapes philippinarum TaxID=129788 RepID=UPI00295BA384|nr:uncharacterized protein LOC132712920 [Ruditapes philippinarum]